MPDPQSYRNHTRFHPPFHFFAAPVLLINVVVAIVVLVRQWPDRVLLHAWLVVLALALLVTVELARSNALRVQNRVIRLEERLRYSSLLSPELARAAEQQLSIQQIVALRFASDAELPSLVQRALAEGLAPKAIKEAVTAWRADTLRV